MNNRKKGQWSPGISGNPSGRPPSGQSLSELAREYLDGLDSKGRPRRELFIAAIYGKSITGDMTAARLLWSYCDGMPKSALDVTNRNAPAINEPVEIYLVNPEDGTRKLWNPA